MSTKTHDEASEIRIEQGYVDGNPFAGVRYVLVSQSGCIIRKRSGFFREGVVRFRGRAKASDFSSATHASKAIKEIQEAGGLRDVYGFKA